MNKTISISKKLLNNKYILKNKLNWFNRLIKRKTRLIIKEYFQKYRIDFQKTFINIIKYSILYILLTKIVIENLKINNINIKTTFLNNKLINIKILIKILKYFKEIFFEIKLRNKLYFKLKKSFYKLKQISKV